VLDAKLYQQDRENTMNFFLYDGTVMISILKKKCRIEWKYGIGQ